MPDEEMMGDEMMAGDEAVDAPESKPLDDFALAIGEAMPDQEWTPDRLAALKEAIKICVESDYAEGKDEPPGKGSLALIFGGGPKKEG